MRGRREARRVAGVIAGGGPVGMVAALELARVRMPWWSAAVAEAARGAEPRCPVAKAGDR